MLSSLALVERSVVVPSSEGASIGTPPVRGIVASSVSTGRIIIHSLHLDSFRELEGYLGSLGWISKG